MKFKEKDRERAAMFLGSGPGKMPNPGQPVAIVFPTSSTFQDAPGAIVIVPLREATRVAALLQDPMLFYVYDEVMVTWQSRVGSVKSKPFELGVRVPMPLFPVDEKRLPMDFHGGRLRVLYPDGSLREPNTVCAACPAEIAVPCKSFFGGHDFVPQLIHKSRELLGCGFVRIGSAAAARHEQVLRQFGGFVFEEGFQQGWQKDRWLTAKMLKDAGFWVTERWGVGRPNMGLGDHIEPESFRSALLRAADAAVLDIEDPDQARAAAEELNVRLYGHDLWHPHRDDDKNEVHVNELNLDADHVRATITATFLGSRERAKKAKLRAQIRRDHCRRCVYTCKFNIGECALTTQDMIEAYPNTDAAREWMAMFAFSARQLKRGRSRLVVYGPNSIDIDYRRYKARHAGNFQFVRDLSPEEVIGAEWQQQLAEEVETIQRWTTEHQAVTFWALRTLWAYGANDAYFNLSQTGDRGRSRSRNDIYYVMLSTSSVNINYTSIEVGSDTRASNHGGFHSRGKQPSIRVDQRPRFTTTYHYPFASDILSWTGRPLGTKKSPLTILS